MVTSSSALTLTLPSDREILMTRTFDAPRRLVWEAWTKPEHVAQWWGPRGWTLPVCDIDLRPGSHYRWVMRGPDGKDHPMSGEYREVVPPERLVYTRRNSSIEAAISSSVASTGSDRFDEPGRAPMESVITMTLEERDGKTTLTSRAVYESAQIRDAILKIGVKEGTAQTFDRLAEHLEAMAKKPVSKDLLITRVFD
ncbi:MAG: hypothetical protein HW397_544, partial [Dehalococcoidia bacterium]|nr:hypothetical protein [Dehalococcoidia bacterium]